MKSGLILLALASLALFSQAGAQDDKECEVCIHVLEEVENSLPDDQKRKKTKQLQALEEYCAQKEIGQKQKKICYWLMPMKRDVAQTSATGMPKKKACKKLSKNNPEVCEVKFPIKVEKGETDYSKLRVKQLKSILADRGVECVGCLEKSDYVKRCQETEHMDL